MKPHEIRPPAGSHQRRNRKGRGESAGKGKTAGRGTKGTRARNTVKTFFEGGQMPLVRRIPKLKGFKPPRRKLYGAVNVTQVGELEGSEIGPDELRAAGLVRKRDELIKILGDGEISRAVTVKAHAFSASARSKIEGAGGSVTVIDRKASE
ncbi:MAG TPA: 50S ribosomal protein L15 [Actinomycetota bacterium]|nr:50S ribosomal protein L15 [Actinomycetota bacterium]